MDVVDLCASSDENSRPSSALEILNDNHSNENGRGKIYENDLCYDSMDGNEDECIANKSNGEIGSLSSASSGVFCSLEAETEKFLSEVNSQNNVDHIDKISDDVIPKMCKKPNNECTNGINKAHLKNIKTVNKEYEKLLKKVESNKKNSIKPGECMKYITVEIGSFILNKAISTDLTQIFTAKKINFIAEAPPIAPDNCIGWTRKYIEHSIGENDQIINTSHCEREKFILVFYEMDEIVDLIMSKTINNYFKNLKDTTDCQISLLLYGTKAFFRKASNKLLIKENDLDYYLTKLLFQESVSCTKIDKPADLADVIMNYTKSVAEIHYKNNMSSLDEQANFYMRGDNRETVQIDKNGNGLTQLWRKTLTKFPLVSLEKAQAICEKFPSPQSLVKKLQSQSPKSAQKMLSEIAIRRSVGPCATTRRIGPELARKIYIYFTTTNGSELLS